MTMLDDGVWIGRGADKYRAEMEGRAIPALRKLLAALGDLRYAMLRAGDTFREAEQEAVRRIERMAEIRDLLVLGGGGAIGGRGGGGSGINAGGRGGQGGGRDFFSDPRPLDGGGGSGAGGVREPSIPDPRIPDIFPVPGHGDVPRPPWFTEFNEDIDGFNGAVKGAVLLIDGGGSHRDHLSNIVGESIAGGGAPVTGMFVQPESLTDQDAKRAAGAIGGFLANNPNAQLKLSPGLQALINGTATDSLGRSLMDMFNQEQVAAARRFIEILKTTAEAFGRVLPFD
jgi:hypothetical protein